jgi:hypothetical protein
VGNGPFKLDLQFFDGSGTPGDLNNNVVTLTNFAFGAGGSALLHAQHDEQSRSRRHAGSFTLAILDSFSSELPTTGPTDEFLDVALTGRANVQVTTYASAPGSTCSLGAPVVTAQSQSSVPEPSALSLLLAGAFGWWAWRCARRRSLS